MRYLGYVFQILSRLPKLIKWSAHWLVSLERRERARRQDMGTRRYLSRSYENLERMFFVFLPSFWIRTHRAHFYYDFMFASAHRSLIEQYQEFLLSLRAACNLKEGNRNPSFFHLFIRLSDEQIQFIPEIHVLTQQVFPVANVHFIRSSSQLFSRLRVSAYPKNVSHEVSNQTRLNHAWLSEVASTPRSRFLVNRFLSWMNFDFIVYVDARELRSNLAFVGASIRDNPHILFLIDDQGVPEANQLNAANIIMRRRAELSWAEFTEFQRRSMPFAEFQLSVPAARHLNSENNHSHV